MLPSGSCIIHQHGLSSTSLPLSTWTHYLNRTEDEGRKVASRRRKLPTYCILTCVAAQRAPATPTSPPGSAFWKTVSSLQLHSNKMSMVYTVTSIFHLMSKPCPQTRYLLNAQLNSTIPDTTLMLWDHRKGQPEPCWVQDSLGHAGTPALVCTCICI